MLIIVNPGNLKYNLVNHIMISSKKKSIKFTNESINSIIRRYKLFYKYQIFKLAICICNHNEITIVKIIIQYFQIDYQFFSDIY